MDRNQLIGLLLGGTAIYLLMQKSAAAQSIVSDGAFDANSDGGVDSTVLDARDWWAQGETTYVPSDSGVDSTVLDARDWWAQNMPTPFVPDPDAIPDDYLNVSVTGDAVPWSEKLIPEQYLLAIRTAEKNYNLPYNMLARLLYQESRYREDIITGKTASPVGALGIAQFMPATARSLGINPLDPAQAIDGAAKYLAQLYNSTGTWAKALAAYNWGIGNVKKKGLAKAPLETRNYYSQILADVGMSSSVIV